MFKWVFLVVILLILVGKFWLTMFFVDGLSMYPTLNNKELAILKKSAYANNTPQRGDVVAVKYPGDPDNKRYIKRVIGLPGEKIEIKNGEVHINDKKLSEPYLEDGVATEPQQIKFLSNNQYFLMGDNRLGSNDSRYFGPVETRFISGQAIYVLYPHSKNLVK